jgi:hypothetical protein
MSPQKTKILNYKIIVYKVSQVENFRIKARINIFIQKIIKVWNQKNIKI